MVFIADAIAIKESKQNFFELKNGDVGIVKKSGDKKFNIQSSRTEQSSEITMAPAQYHCTRHW